MARSARIAAFAVALTAAADAHAGRMRFGWLYDTETVPQRGVEIETWIQEENVFHDESTLFWWGPIVGITDRIELALPVAFKLESDLNGAAFGFDRFGADLRVKLTNPDPVEAGPFAMLVRAAVFREAVKRNTVRFEAGVVMSVDLSRVRMALDAEFVSEVGYDDPLVLELEPAAGVSVRLFDEFRLGAEAASSLHLTDDSRWVAAGPDLSWTHGRFWVSGAFLWGVFGIRTAPRVNFGVAF